MNTNTPAARHPWVSLREGSRHPGNKELPLGPQDLHKMLERLCDLTKLTGPARHAALKYQAITLNGKSLAFKMEEWSGFVKIFIDVGLPKPDSEHEAYRYLLEQQLYMPAPFSIVPAVHPESKHIVLCGCAPLPTQKEDDIIFLSVLQTCVATAERLVELCLR